MTMQNQPIPAPDGLPPHPATPQDLFNVLESLKIPYSLHHHAPIFTVAEGEPLKKSIPGLHCRNLFLRDKKGRMALVTVANETPVDLKALQRHLGMDRLSFGSPERLWDALGVRPGSVCPFAIINDRTHRRVHMVLDAGMMRAERVVYHPLDNAMSIGLAPTGLRAFIDWCGHVPQEVDFGPGSQPPLR